MSGQTQQIRTNGPSPMSVGKEGVVKATMSRIMPKDARASVGG